MGPENERDKGHWIHSVLTIWRGGGKCYVGFGPCLVNKK